MERALADLLDTPHHLLGMTCIRTSSEDSKEFENHSINGIHHCLMIEGSACSKGTLVNLI